LDLFSGIGGFSLGLESTNGFETVAFCEIDQFCRKVLAKHWPGVPCFEDIRTAKFPYADVVCGGFPCQDLSVAGKRAGLAGERSGLYRELVRAVRVVRPRYVIVENVAALLSAGMGDVLGDLASCGYNIEHDCIPASALGAPHRRDRVFIVAHADNRHRRQENALCAGRNTFESCFENAADTDCMRRLQPQGCQQNQRRRSSHSSAKWDASDSAGIGRGKGWRRRPADSFAWIRDKARRDIADAPSAGLERRKQSETARSEFSISSSDYSNPWRTWTDEPPIQRVDDGVSSGVDGYWAERTKATGNTIVPQIAQLIGYAILEREALMGKS
jgi:DNA (cytosine-5)-methyltransferase 1